MNADQLFPPDVLPVPPSHPVWMCFRCGSVVASTRIHLEWHAAVDSAATTVVARHE